MDPRLGIDVVANINSSCYYQESKSVRQPIVSPNYSGSFKRIKSHVVLVMNSTLYLGSLGLKS
jgi:hypothetical protein